MLLGVLSVVLEIAILVGSETPLSWENIFHSVQLNHRPEVWRPVEPIGRSSVMYSLGTSHKASISGYPCTCCHLFLGNLTPPKFNTAAGEGPCCSLVSTLGSWTILTQFLMMVGLQKLGVQEGSWPRTHRLVMTWAEEMCHPLLCSYPSWHPSLYLRNSVNQIILTE